MLILDDRVFDDLFELGPKITCVRDRVSDSECAQADFGLAGLTWWGDKWNTCRRFVDAVGRDMASVYACGCDGCRFADIDEGFALQRNQMGDEGPTEGV